jgi:hypothetical protein
LKDIEEEKVAVTTGRDTPDYYDENGKIATLRVRLQYTCQIFFVIIICDNLRKIKLIESNAKMSSSKQIYL